MPDTQRPSTWRTKFPPLPVRLLLAAIFIGIVILRASGVVGDFAVMNVFTFLGILLAMIILSIWFTFFSGYSVRSRVLIWGLAIVAFLFASFCYTVDHVSGELVPRFRLRWAKKPDELLARPVQANDRANVQLVATDTDFWQFLGPKRNARVDHVELSRDWNTSPPKRLWKQAIGAGWSAFSAAGDFAVTLEQRGPEEFVTCYDIETGQVVWGHGTPGRHQTVPGGVGPRSTPTIHDGRVYALTATGVLLCLDGQTGKVVWRDNLLARFGVKEGQDDMGVAWGRAGSPLIVDDMVVVPAGGPAQGKQVSLAAFDNVTGSLAWQAGEDQISYSSPVLATVAGVRQVLSVNEKTVTGHDPATGKQRWQFTWPGNSTQDTNASQPVPVGENRVFVSKGYSQGAALFEISGSPDDGMKAVEVWSDTKILKTKFTNVTIYRNHIYGLSDGILECIEAATGTRMWKKGRYGQGQILGVGSLILVQAESGEVAMVEATPEEYRELGRFQAVEGVTWNNLCLQGKRLLVRNSQEAACYQLP